MAHYLLTAIKAQIWISTIANNQSQCVSLLFIYTKELTVSTQSLTFGSSIATFV